MEPPPGPDPAASGEEPGTPPRLTVIGTGHVFDIGAAVRGAVFALRPDAVFVELDRGRLQALLARRQGKELPRGRQPYVHRRLQRFQEEIAAMYGTEAGNEMLAAVLAARDVGARVHLIDPPVEDTLRRALKGLTVREWLRIGGLAVKGTFQNLLPGRRRRGRQQVEDEIRRYQEDPAAAMDEMRRRLPTVHRILIEERDERMAAAVARALPGIRHGLLVVGDGHVNGITVRLDAAMDVYRLADVREGRLPAPPEATGEGTSTVRFGFDVRLD